MLKRWSDALLDRLIGLSTALAALTLLFVAALILADVIGRNLLGQPITGTRDIVQMALIVIIFGALAICDRSNANISVDILESVFPEQLNLWLNVAGRILGTVIFLIIAIRMIQNTEISRLLNQSTNMLNIPKAPFEYLIAGFSLLTALSMLFSSIQDGRKALRYKP